MTRNIGQIDRVARFALGALLIVLAAMGTIGIWGYLGAIFVGTAFVSFCPLYRIVGLKTCKDC
ncbi:MAG: DUF2892 domain-containing protein [Pseudomonadota bacterium]